MMSSKTTTIHIRGGKPLKGEVRIMPNKNAVLPAIAAAVLTDETMTYHNMPTSSPDVHKMLLALKDMGAIIDTTTATVTICCKELHTWIVPPEHIRDMQAAYLLAGPLLARFGKASIPIAFGCQLGYRGYEAHTEYLTALDVSFEVIGDTLELKLNHPIKDTRLVVVDEQYHNDRIVTYKRPNVTPTESALMLLSRTSWCTTEVSGIAQEPHVAQLLDLLHRMGADIKGKGSTIRITGFDKLRGVEFNAECDHVDYFRFAVTAAMSKSDLFLRVPTKPLSNGIKHMNVFLHEIGIEFEVIRDGVMIYGSRSSYAPVATFPKADTHVYDMTPGPWPAFPVDCLPSFIAYSSMNADTSTSTYNMNWMYKDGLSYVPVMEKMGAKIVSFDDRHVAIIGGVEGGNPYNNVSSVIAPKVIEGVGALISCALAGGTHTIEGVEYILRRNPEFFNILKQLGADFDLTEHEKAA